LAESGGNPWLLLIHQLPAKPDYLRVKVWRRLQRIGAVAMKNAVWALPRSDVALEDFHWLLKEIAADGGEAMLCEASFVAGLTEAQEALLERLDPTRERMRRRPAEVVAALPAPPVGEGASRVGGRVWVTRAGVHVDRIASAWLICRRLDPEARFRFVAESGYAPAAGGAELRFDMFEGEFTHEGDRCTFEVLASRFAPGDAALQRMARMVHDLDFKDAKYGAPETAGFALALEGICARHASDGARLESGAALLDDVYAGLGAAGQAGEPPAAPGPSAAG